MYLFELSNCLLLIHAFLFIYLFFNIPSLNNHKHDKKKLPAQTGVVAKASGTFYNTIKN